MYIVVTNFLRTIVGVRWKLQKLKAKQIPRTIPFNKQKSTENVTTSWTFLHAVISINTYNNLDNSWEEIKYHYKHFSSSKYFLENWRILLEKCQTDFPPISSMY